MARLFEYTGCDTAEELAAFWVAQSFSHRDAFAASCMEEENAASVITLLTGCGTADEFSGFLGEKYRNFLRGVLCTGPQPRCFLPNTMLYTDTEKTTTKTVTSLQPSDVVLNAFGEEVKVFNVAHHEEEMREVVELRTRACYLQVSSTHRVVIPNSSGDPQEVVYASSLKPGDIVFCGSQPRPTPIVKVLKHRISTGLVEITFETDDPVESFMQPKWCILTKGQEPAMHYDTDDGF